MSATLKDVASLAQVGVSTASYVINRTGLKKVGEETQKRILSAAASLNYHPCIAAKGLKKGKTFLVGGVFPSILGSFVPELLQGLEDALNSYSYSLLLCTYRNLQELEAKCTLLCSKHVDGAIILPETSEKFVNIYMNLLEKMPIVSVAKQLSQPSIPYVMVDGQQIGFLGTEYLLKNGHRRIAFIPSGDLKRLDGYAKALKMYSVPYREELIFELKSIDAEGGRHIFRSVNNMIPRPTAIFAPSDYVASEIIDEAQLYGIKVPDELSVIGTDGLSLCSLIRPHLTSVAQPKYEQGFIAGELLLQLIGHKTTESKILQPYLVEKDSVCQMKLKK